MVATIQKPNCWKSEPNGGHFVPISDGFGQKAAILFKTEHHWKTERHWNTEHRITIGIQNVFIIPAPTVSLRYFFQLFTWTCMLLILVVVHFHVFGQETSLGKRLATFHALNGNYKQNC